MADALWVNTQGQTNALLVSTGNYHFTIVNRTNL